MLKKQQQVSSEGVPAVSQTIRIVAIEIDAEKENPDEIDKQD